MKRNLFVVHTQYNMILACGLALTDFIDNKNEMIVFEDFEMTNELKSRLNSLFSSVTYFAGSYQKENTRYINKIKKYPKVIKKIKEIFKGPFNNVLVIDDMCIPEMYILKYADQINPNTNFIWLEDGCGAYYSNKVKDGGLSKNKITRFIRKLIFGYVLGLRSYYDLGYFMGSHYMLKRAYVILPSLVRQEYKNKQLLRISAKSLEKGIKHLYEGIFNQIKGKALILLIDKLSIYADYVNICELYGKIATEYADKGYKVYFKYHPREDSTVSQLHQYIELDKSLAIESYYANIVQPDEVVVVGARTTALVTAKLLGFQAISILNIIDASDKMTLDFFKLVNIELYR